MLQNRLSPRLAALFFPSLKTKLLILLIVFITSLGIGLRLYAAPRLSIDVDERIYLQSALKYANFMRDGQWNMLVWYDYNSEHPVFYKIVYGVALLTQPRLDFFDTQLFIDGKAMYKVKDSQWGLTCRYVSVIFGGLTILALAVVNPIAGLYFAIDTLAVQFNSSLFLESLPALTSFLCAFAYLHWYQHIYRKSRPLVEDFVWLGLSAGFLGMSAASKYTYATVGLAIVIHFAGGVILKKNRPADLWKLAAWGLAALLVFFVCDPYLWKHPFSRLLGTLNFHMQHTQSDRVTTHQYGFYQPFIWLSGPNYKIPGNANAIIPIKLDTLIGLLALIGLPRLRTRQPFYFIWLVTGLVVLMLWPTKWLQYTMIVMVPVCTSAAMGTTWLYDLLKNSLISWRNRPKKASAAPGLSPGK